MTLFGQTLDGQQIFSLISMLAVLALCMVTLRRRREHDRQVKRWKKEQEPRQAQSRDPRHSGPWG
ncbi:hypothetical protein [Brevundimonas guildfordensis]|uniref:Uncharacterized protein n=1 Tax=Brevundimonas guildfordensis TaxID=2762241 RepID=A0ABR8QZS4_9CAUL|nr:hypothetical protein [Brevundimonas guildfordensis]MBD7941033.1 hypothetical protein [Brevundimonas guildfordensis]